MLRVFWLFGTLALVCKVLLQIQAQAQAQTTTSPLRTVQRGQPNPAALEGLCNDIYRQRVDTSSRGNYTYAYERKIFEAAGVDFESDSQKSARSKIQQMWIRQRHRLICDGANFRIANGSVLKYAIETNTFSFLDNATRFWGVEINFIDKADGATTLDYLADRILENSGNALGRTLRNHYDNLRRYGARHCRELPDTSECAPWELLRTDPLNHAPSRPGRSAM